MSRDAIDEAFKPIMDLAMSRVDEGLKAYQSLPCSSSLV